MDAGDDGSGGGVFAGINVTPLVDVMLVLLVIFMITAPMLAAGLEVQLPRESAAATEMQEDSPLVTVTKDGRIIKDGKDIASDVEAALARDDRLPAGPLYIEADADARYADVARVLAAARSQGVEGLSLLVEPRTAEAP